MSLFRSLVLIALGAVAALLIIGSNARAESPRTAECVWRVPNAPVSIGGEKALNEATGAIQAWMNTQLAAGRSEFAVMPIPATTQWQAVCAW